MEVTIAYLEEIGLLGDEPPKHIGCGNAPSAGSTSSEPKPKKEKAKAKGPEQAPAALENAAAPVKELSKEELAKMSKEERTAYYAARKAMGLQAKPGASNPEAKAQPQSKADRRAQQEAQRKAKEDKKQDESEQTEQLKELILQGLSEEQAKAVLEEMAHAKVEDDGGDDADEDDAADFFSSVRSWMNGQTDAKATKEWLHDFNMKVRFQGHVDTTPPDHLGAILKVLAGYACADSDLKKMRQPDKVAKKVESLIDKWAYFIETLYSKIGDSLEAADVLVKSVHEGVQSACTDVPAVVMETVVVGILMAIREQIEDIPDEELLTGCRRLEPRSLVMDKFIEFLDEDDEDDDDDGED